MCGIAAILLYPEDRPVEQWQAITQAFSMNLILNEQRGTAATGIAVIDAGGTVALHKVLCRLPCSPGQQSTKGFLSCVGAETLPDSRAPRCRQKGIRTGPPTTIPFGRVL